MTNDIMKNTEQVENPSVFGLVLNPKEQFEKIKANPKSVLAVIIVTIVTFIGILFMYFNFSIPEELSEGFSEQELQLMVNAGKITLLIGGILGPIFGITIASLVYFVVAKMIKSSVSFKQMFSMFAHVNIIGAIGSIVHGLTIMLLPKMDLNVSVTSLGSIIEIEGMVGAVLDSIDIFGIWQLIITAIGLQIVAKFSKTAAWTTVIIIALIGTVFTAISFALNSVTGL